MKKLTIILVMLMSAGLLFGKGLRYSVCQVAPEYTEEDKTVLSDLALFLSRIGNSNGAHSIQNIIRDGYYGSGVVVRRDGLMVLTSRQVVGYAEHATVTVYLHDKTLRFRGCKVVGCDPDADLVFISLPSSTDLEPLPLADRAVDDGDQITSVGFALLNNQALWQMNPGFVSNSLLNFEGKDYIHHSAPFNPGLSGGPILVKDSSGYTIAGINMGSILRRDEMALAVPLAKLRHAMQQSELHNDHADLYTYDKRIGSKWQEFMKSFDSEDLKALKEYGAGMPVDYILRLWDKRAEADSIRTSQPGLTKDISRFKQSVFYHNYFSAGNQETGISMEFALGKRRMAFLGLQFSCSLTDARPESYWYSGFYQHKLFDPEPIFSPLFGMYVGAQFPIRLARRHVIVPRLSQGGNLGPCLNSLDETTGKYSVRTLLITSDSRVGIEYHYQFDKIALICALEYTAHIFATDAEVVWRYTNGTTTTIDPKTRLLYINNEAAEIMYNCFNHGLGIRLAVGF